MLKRIFGLSIVILGLATSVAAQAAERGIDDWGCGPQVQGTSR